MQLPFTLDAASLVSLAVAVVVVYIFLTITFLATRNRLLDAVLVVACAGLLLALVKVGGFVLEVLGAGYYLGVPPYLSQLEAFRDLIAPSLGLLEFCAWLLAQLDAATRRRWGWGVAIFVGILFAEGCGLISHNITGARDDPVVVSVAHVANVLTPMMVVVAFGYSLLSRPRRAASAAPTLPPSLAPLWSGVPQLPEQAPLPLGDSAPPRS